MPFLIISSNFFLIKLLVTLEPLHKSATLAWYSILCNYCVSLCLFLLFFKPTKRSNRKNPSQRRVLIKNFLIKINLTHRSSFSTLHFTVGCCVVIGLVPRTTLYERLLNFYVFYNTTLFLFCQPKCPIRGCLQLYVILLSSDF